MDENKRTQFRCSNCDRLVATFPEGEYPEEELVCPGCGARVRPPGVLKRITDKVTKELSGSRPEADQSDKEK
jgi:DNA-directed RNA polymerase subunit RPC12/RpoP